ncbi:D-alanyl-D-alanine carboxypeptidase/D-alanyl-D-alanine-endopeptidase [Virgibacillus sp. NKC19-3]|uniref:D-alanyl-D-alanine carboxypeptidase/D-alanyl-D-alanine endopeptidase n=1 Tax=Virgibacillus saliphilus TaxID=2831674 RepID=UPI001C9AEE19|nr:D-alanyl-D-alanine carboxypeptidase/D-alanyl-D-alanine-endopeptidase [Virgibacillus sp. NKC19-3]MBY7145113.1 D-alanyl-D-alanine carboxypeptidase/D-alanyl-D-alanine-endopeptidase [Virgibacillus sp. NKC19-3]
MLSKNPIKKLLFCFLIAILAVIPFMKQEEGLFVTASEESIEEIKEMGALEEKMDAILDDERLDGAVGGVSVRQADTGDMLYSRDGDTRLHPASNMKLLTGAAAMETLGKEYQFSTEVWTDGQLRGDVLQGNVYLKGKGDPTLLKEDLDQFAKDLKDQGIHKIQGNVIADDSWYDDVRLSEDLNWSDEPFHTGAQVSALTLSPDKDYDAGTVIVEVSADADAEQAEIQITPETDYVTVVNNTEMVADTEDKDISIEREHGSNTIIVEGEMPASGSDYRSWASVWEPTGYALNVFKQSLEENGVTFAGNSKLGTGVTPEDVSLVTSKKSMPIEELFIPFMKLSNNGHGEILTKEMGKVARDEGSWDKGLEVIEDTLVEFGMDGDTIMLRDGSGMSHKNMIPANDLTQMLYAIQDKDWFPAFEYSLPVAGDPERLVGGTLRDRMTEGPARGNVVAKTGSLTGVSTLSGYVTAADGERLIFAVMINNHLDDSVTAIEDAIGHALAGHEFDE